MTHSSCPRTSGKSNLWFFSNSLKRLSFNFIFAAWSKSFFICSSKTFFRSFSESWPNFLASSSFILESTGLKISIISTLNSAFFPSSSLFGYSSGNLTLTIFEVSAFSPTSWSSKVSIKVLEPRINSAFSAVPPSKFTPSIEPE